MKRPVRQSDGMYHLENKKLKVKEAPNFRKNQYLKDKEVAIFIKN